MHCILSSFLHHPRFISPASFSSSFSSSNFLFPSFFSLPCSGLKIVALLTWYLVPTTVVMGTTTSSSYPIMNNHRYDHHHSSTFPSSSSSSSSSSNNNPHHHYVGGQSSSSPLSQQSDQQPYFVERMQNVTIPVGREATFTCLIHNLKNHQVS